MKGWLALALLGLLSTAALAADNATLITPCATGCVTVRAKDVGVGVQSPVYILGDTSGNPIYGTAGTANANILTVQGIASMTKLLVDGSGVTQPVSGTVTANAGSGTFTVGGTVAATQSGTWTVQQGTPPWSVNGNVASAATDSGNPEKVGGVFNTTQPTVTTGQRVDAQSTARGGLIVATGVDAFAATVSGTVTANQGGAPWSQNVTQFGSVNLSTGTGASGTGIPRVTISNDSSLAANQSVNVAQVNGTAPAVKASGTNVATTDTSIVVGLSPNPSTVCTSIKPISQTGSTDLITSTNKLHICAILIVSATAQSVSLVEGTVTTCGTGTAALMGATTAANGMALAANGGFTHTADRPFMVTQTTADHLCLLQSGAGNVSGFISYTDHN